MRMKKIKDLYRDKWRYLEKQAQEGNSRVRLEMTNKRAKQCQNVKKC